MWIPTKFTCWEPEAEQYAEEIRTDYAYAAAEIYAKRFAGPIKMPRPGSLPLRVCVKDEAGNISVFDVYAYQSEVTYEAQLVREK